MCKYVMLTDTEGKKVTFESPQFVKHYVLCVFYFTNPHSNIVKQIFYKLGNSGSQGFGNLSSPQVSKQR